MNTNELTPSEQGPLLDPPAPPASHEEPPGKSDQASEAPAVSASTEPSSSEAPSQPAQPSQPAEPAEPRDERVRKVYVKDVREHDKLVTVFVVTRKQLQAARRGGQFLILGLGDRTGELDARGFDHAEALDKRCAVGDYVLVEGHVISFHGRPQLVVSSLDRLDPEPIDPGEFTLPAAPRAEPRREDVPAPVVATAPGGLKELAEALSDRHLRQLIGALLEDAELSRLIAGAPGHKQRGRTLELAVSTARLASRVGELYPSLDRDLLLCGALLTGLSGLSETDERRLLGPGHMMAQKIHAAASRIDGFPPLLARHLVHTVLAAQPEGGIPPATLEALTLKALTSLDQQLAEYGELLSRDGKEGGHWTEPSRFAPLSLWRGPSPTGRPKRAGERRPRRSREERRRQRDAQGPGPQSTGPGMRDPEASQASGQAQATTEPARPQAHDRDPKLPPELAFKPFAMLTGEGADS